MEAIDPNLIDQSSLLGQVTLFVAAIGVLLTSIKHYLPKGDGARKSKVEALKDRAKASDADSAFTRKINSNLSEWQLTSREVIRVLKNELVASGIPIPDRVIAMEAHMKSIDEREVFNDSESE